VSGLEGILMLVLVTCNGCVREIFGLGGAGFHNRTVVPPRGNASPPPLDEPPNPGDVQALVEDHIGATRDFLQRPPQGVVVLRRVLGAPRSHIPLPNGQCCMSTKRE
jgi:hypothetical protein